jgi:hypothetical protein
MKKFLVSFVTVASMIFTGASAAVEQPSSSHRPLIIRATIENIHGQTLDVKSRSGVMLKLNITTKAPVNEVVKEGLSDIKVGSYLAITGQPQPDGSQKAIAILIFPPALHPPAGFNPWDFSQNSTMTNATVAEQVTGVDGQTLTVKYPGGEKKIIVPPSAEITTFKKATIADLKPGQRLLVFAAKKLPDGTLEAPNIAFGHYGVWR